MDLDEGASMHDGVVEVGDLIFTVAGNEALVDAVLDTFGGQRYYRVWLREACGGMISTVSVRISGDEVLNVLSPEVARLWPEITAPTAEDALVRAIERLPSLGDPSQREAA